MTALMEAVKQGRTEIAQLLLQAGANKDLQDGEGTTPVMLAASNGHTELAQLLLQAGGDQHLQDHEGRTPLLQTAVESPTEIAQVLLQADLNKDLQNRSSRTALMTLMEAWCKDYTEITWFLRGFADGIAALMLVARRGYTEMEARGDSRDDSLVPFSACSWLTAVNTSKKCQER